MKMYYSGCNLVLALIVALLCGQSKGIWPFTSVHATPDSQDIVYPDANAKRVAIIGMLNFIDSSSLVPRQEYFLINNCTFSE
jgi:hypothetical protein